MFICNCFQDQCSMYTSRFCNAIEDFDERNDVCVLQSLCPTGTCSISNFVAEPFLHLYMRLILLGDCRAFNMKIFSMWKCCSHAEKLPAAV
jgi:hypothetical protein